MYLYICICTYNGIFNTEPCDFTSNCHLLVIVDIGESAFNFGRFKLGFYVKGNVSQPHFSTHHHFVWEMTNGRLLFLARTVAVCNILKHVDPTSVCFFCALCSVHP